VKVIVLEAIRSTIEVGGSVSSRVVTFSVLLTADEFPAASLAKTVKS